MTIQEMKSKMISLGLVKTKTDKKIFNEIKGTRTFQHSTAGIQVKQLQTDEDVLKAWSKYKEMCEAEERHLKWKREFDMRNPKFKDYSNQAYNNSADDL